MAKEEFLKKVYDRYLGSDYEYGVSDLNPKREISKTSFQSIEDEEAAILSVVSTRIAAIKSSLSSLPNYKIPEKINNDDFTVETSGGGFLPDKQPDVLPSKLIALTNAGKSPLSDNIFVPPVSKEASIDAYLGQIDVLLASVLSMIESNETPFDDMANAVNMFNMGCDGFVYEEVLGQSDKENDKKGKGKENELKGDGSGDNNDNEENNEDTNSANIDAAEAAEVAADERDKADNKDADTTYKEVAECAALELGILQIILTILKIISIIKRSVLFILSILVPIVKIVTLASQCWINPPAAGQVIQLIAEKIASMIISLIGTLLQKIWESLGLDCKTQQVQDLLDQINDVLAGVDSVINYSENLINFTKNNAVDMYKQLETATSNFSQDPGIIKELNYLKDKGLQDFSDSLNKNLFGEDGITSEKGWKTLMTKALKESGLASKLNSIINSTQEATKRTQKLAKKATDNKAVNNTLEKMSGFIGSFEIN